VDRASRHTLPRRPDGKTADAVGAAMTRMPGSLPVHTVTADSGREFADHARVSRALGADFLFARPYRYRERGPTGHTNGLVRRYLPRGTDFRKVTDARPHRILGHLTPDRAFPRGIRAAGGRDPFFPTIIHLKMSTIDGGHYQGISSTSERVNRMDTFIGGKK